MKKSKKEPVVKIDWFPKMKQKPLTAKQWLRELQDVDNWLKNGITVTVAARMLENYAAYRMNFERDKNLPQPPLLTFSK